jgi:hypothetical protein
MMRFSAPGHGDEDVTEVSERDAVALHARAHVVDLLGFDGGGARLEGLGEVGGVDEVVRDQGELTRGAEGHVSVGTEGTAAGRGAERSDLHVRLRRDALVPRVQVDGAADRAAGEVVDARVGVHGAAQHRRVQRERGAGRDVGDPVVLGEHLRAGGVGDGVGVLAAGGDSEGVVGVVDTEGGAAECATVARRATLLVHDEFAHLGGALHVHRSRCAEERISRCRRSGRQRPADEDHRRGDERRAHGASDQLSRTAPPAAVPLGRKAIGCVVLAGNTKRHDCLPIHRFTGAHSRTEAPAPSGDRRAPFGHGDLGPGHRQPARTPRRDPADPGEITPTFHPMDPDL